MQSQMSLEMSLETSLEVGDVLFEESRRTWVVVLFESTPLDLVALQDMSSVLHIQFACKSKWMHLTVPMPTRDLQAVAAQQPAKRLFASRLRAKSCFDSFTLGPFGADDAYIHGARATNQTAAQAIWELVHWMHSFRISSRQQLQMATFPLFKMNASTKKYQVFITTVWPLSIWYEVFHAAYHEKDHTYVQDITAVPARAQCSECIITLSLIPVDLLLSLPRRLRIEDCLYSSSSDLERGFDAMTARISKEPSTMHPELSTNTLLNVSALSWLYRRDQIADSSLAYTERLHTLSGQKRLVHRFQGYVTCSEPKDVRVLCDLSEGRFGKRQRAVQLLQMPAQPFAFQSRYGDSSQYHTHHHFAIIRTPVARLAAASKLICLECVQ